MPWPAESLIVWIAKNTEICKQNVTEITLVLVSYSTMLLNARDDGQSGSQRKKEEKNTAQIRVT